MFFQSYKSYFVWKSVTSSLFFIEEKQAGDRKSPFPGAYPMNLIDLSISKWFIPTFLKFFPWISMVFL